MPSIVELPTADMRCNDMARFVGPYLRDHKPDVIVLSGDWLTYASRMGFDGMTSELKNMISKLKSDGIRAVLVGPTVQFRGTLPWIALRIEARHISPVPVEKILIPDIFTLDSQMKATLSGVDGVSYVSVLENICPARRCPIVLDNGAPLTFDHAHLTSEGSEFIAPYIAKAGGLPLAAVPPK